MTKNSGEDWIASRMNFYWHLAGVAIFLLVPVDMTTTMYAAFVYGTDAESNQIIAWALNEGPVVFAGINLVGGFLVALIFYGLLTHMKESTHPRVLGHAYEVWVTILIGIGLFVAVNNLTVVFLGQSIVQALPFV